jgi:arabinosaccharide transport system substrate-binding protein
MGSGRGQKASLRIRTFSDFFPFGTAPFIILVLTVVAGLYLLTHPGRDVDADLRMWTFPDNHYQAYVNAAPDFARQSGGKTVSVEWVHGTVIGQRLRAAFWSRKNVPDLAEMEITWAGTFFRGPVEEIGFIDLRPYLARDGLLDKVVQTRLAPYTHRGRVYGVPHDVHPVMLAYRRDLFEKHGIQADELTTWAKFIEAGRKFSIARGGRDDRYMINLSRTEAYSFEVLLFQRSVPGRPAGYFDRDGRVIMDNDIAVEMLIWYIPLVAGPRRIAGGVGMFGQPWIKSVQDGYCLCEICPDWKSKSYERQIPEMSGRMALMPLPAFASDGAGARRTSTWGGTMLGITKSCQDKELAWQLVKFLYFSKSQADRLFRDLNILACYTDAWTIPALDEKRPYWSDQALGRLYAGLAAQTPPQFTSPFVEAAKGEMSTVIADAVSHYERHGEKGFEDYCRRRLERAADAVRKKKERNPF